MKLINIQAGDRTAANNIIAKHAGAPMSVKDIPEGKRAAILAEIEKASVAPAVTADEL